MWVLEKENKIQKGGNYQRKKNQEFDLVMGNMKVWPRDQQTFYKGPDRKYYRFYRSQSVSLATTQLYVITFRQSVKKWAWLYSSEILFMDIDIWIPCSFYLSWNHLSFSSYLKRNHTWVLESKGTR